MITAQVDGTKACVAHARNEGMRGEYARCLVWYLLGMVGLWLLGIEASYGNPTPFYALPIAAFNSIYVPAGAIAAMWLAMIGVRHFVYGATPRAPRAALAKWGIFVFLLTIGFIIYARGSVSGAGTELGEHASLLRWHWLAIGVFTVFASALAWLLRRANWPTRDLDARTVRLLLVGAVLFAILFSASVAMIRGGPQGIAQAYERQQYESISDIGIGGSMRGLFRDYIKVHPYLSLHSKVHPPASVVLLWVLSYVAGRGAMGLSLATIVVGSLGVVPLFFWTRDMTNQRTAVTASLLYVVMPSIVLFTATSIDILFTPLTITTLWLFWRAMHRPSWKYALGAGALYAVLSLTSFSLLGLGAFFGLVGLFRLRAPEARRTVLQTAGAMLAAFVGVHVAVRLWSGFDVIACFQACKAQFDVDQVLVDEHLPRFAGWTWRLLNPACWFYFAGIPVSLLLLRRLWRPESSTKALFVVFGLTLVALNLLYLGRGEGERSAMYLLPFMAIPAGHLLAQWCRDAQSGRMLVATVAFLAFQCWLTESYFYTYW